MFRMVQSQTKYRLHNITLSANLKIKLNVSVLQNHNDIDFMFANIWCMQQKKIISFSSHNFSTLGVLLFSIFVAL